MKSLFFSLLVVLNLGVHAADNYKRDIVEIAVDTPELSTLVTAVQVANLVDTLQSPGPFTVFAPTNDAFTDPTNGVLAELGLSGFGEGTGELNAATTDTVLLYHIVGANVQSDQLATGTVTTLGGDITANTSNFTLTDANGRVSNIVTSLVDIQAINGVVHVIDKVILFPLP